jgi:hypothetical protein
VATEHPITLEDYLVRLWVAKKIDAEIYPEDNDTSTISSLSATILVKTWKKLAKELVKVLDSKQISTPTGKKNAFQMLKWCFVLILDQS